jgi:hypothetical protein
MNVFFDLVWIYPRRQVLNLLVLPLSRIVQILTQKSTERHKSTAKELEEAEAQILRLEVLSMCPHTTVYESVYY